MASAIIHSTVAKPCMISLITCIKKAFALQFSGTCKFLIMQLSLACTSEVSLNLFWKEFPMPCTTIVRTCSNWKHLSCHGWLSSYLWSLLCYPFSSVGWDRVFLVAEFLFLFFSSLSSLLLLFFLAFFSFLAFIWFSPPLFSLLFYLLL